MTVGTTLALGCVADDYTGASDLANTLTRAGLRTAQTIGVPADGLELPEVDAVVVSLKSRSIAADAAVGLALDAQRWLAARGARHTLFKICSTFDSTDQGNIGPVTDALRAACGGGPVLVTPAFPETERTVFMGHLFVGSQPLHESPLKDHPLNPMRDSNLVRVLARQSHAGASLIDRMTVARGADAVADADLEIIGAVALDGPLSTGASGLGLGLARALAFADARLGAGPVVIASSATPDRVAALQARHGREAVGHRVEQALADIAASLTERGVRRLVVAGGETSGAVVDRLGVPAFLVGPEIAPGVPVLCAAGLGDGDRLMALESGNFGGRGFFANALALMG